MKDYILSSMATNQYLNSVVSLAIAYLEKGHFLEAGGYYDQPYFFQNFIVPWVDQGLAERRAVNRQEMGK